MPETDSQGVRIHYRVEGSGPPLVLQHGFMQSIEDWFEAGYIDALKGQHRVILVDARGHGRSDKPHDTAAYGLQHQAGDVVAVLDALGIERAHFWGYSMGGRIGYAVAEYAPHRLNRLVIGGAHPYAQSQELWRKLLGAGLDQGRPAFVASFEQLIGTILPSWRARLLDADLDAFLAAGGEDRVSHEAALATIALPAFVYSGDADPRFIEARTAAASIRGAKFLAVAGLNHLEGFVRSDLILPPVMEFLAG